jgi:hypothetical protein
MEGRELEASAMIRDTAARSLVFIWYFLLIFLQNLIIEKSI